MKSIGLVWYSPASVNCSKPLVKLLSMVYDVRIIVLSDYGVKESLEFNCLENISIYDFKYFDGLDLIIYNTGSGGIVETLIPLEAEEVGAISVSIMDIFWSSLTNYENRFKNVPDYIITITEDNKKDLLKVVDIESNRVFSLGNPYFDRLSQFECNEVIEKDSYSVSFLSQCSSGGGLAEDTCDKSKDLILEILDLKEEGLINNIKIYRHPRENMDFYNFLNLIVERSNDFIDMIESDILISVGSTPQYEAMLIGKNGLFYSSEYSLKSRLLDGKWDKIDDNVVEIGKSTENVFDFIKSLL